MEAPKKRTNKGLKSSNQNIVQPAIKPNGTNRDEWADYAWSSKDY